MKKLLFVAALSLAVFASSAAHAVGVVSANGFTCTAQPANNRNLVECIGQFPGVAGLFAATGYDIVHVEFSPDNQKRYFYMSETGCLILNANDNTALAADKSGQRKQFPAFMDAMNWCYTSAMTPAAPSGQQGAAPQQGQMQQQTPPQTQPPAQSQTQPKAQVQVPTPAQQPAAQAKPQAQQQGQVQLPVK